MALQRQAICPPELAAERHQSSHFAMAITRLEQEVRKSLIIYQWLPGVAVNESCTNGIRSFLNNQIGIKPAV